MMDPSFLSYDQKLIIAKVAEAIILIYSTYCFLAPPKGRKIYFKNVTFKDPKKTVAVLDYIGQRSAMTLLGPAISWWLKVDGVVVDLEILYALNTLPWILLSLHSLLNEIPKEVGLSPYVELFMLTIHVFGGLATFFKTTYSTLAIQICLGWLMTNAILLAFGPVLFGKIYALPEREEIVLFVRKHYGWNLINLAIFIYAFTFELLDDVKLVGYCWLVALFNSVLLSNEMKQLGADMTNVYIWWVLMIFFGVTLVV